MTETEWMYDSLTERFGETLGERQRVVDALLIAKAVVGPGPLGGTNSDSLLAAARFILDEWGKYSDAEDEEGLDTPVVLDNGVITRADFDLMKYGRYTFPEGSRWVDSQDQTLIFTEGNFWAESPPFTTNSYTYDFPFIRVKEEN